MNVSMPRGRMPDDHSADVQWFLRITVLIASASIVGCAADSASPSSHPSLRIVAGADVSDTVLATLPSALVVEVRDAKGQPTPQGTPVSFTALMKPSTRVVPVWIRAPADSAWSFFVPAATDAAGRSSISVRLSIVAGDGPVEIRVPSLSLVDTAHFTLLPGAPARIVVAPLDTAVSAGQSFSVRGGVADQFGNFRTESVAWSAVGSGISVSTTGVVTATAVGRFGAQLNSAIPLSPAIVHVSVVPQIRFAAVGGMPATLFLTDADGHDQRMLSPLLGAGPETRPEWMPGLGSIVYMTTVNNRRTLLVVDTNAVVHPFFANGIPGVTDMEEAAPSSDGQWLYFVARDDICQINYCLYRAKIDGSSPERLGTPDISGSRVHPSPSPDGRYVAISTGGLGWDGIRVFDIASRTSTLLTSDGVTPAWSPDGTEIAFVATFGGDVSIIHPDGTGLRVFSTGRWYLPGVLNWTRDGRYIVAQFISNSFDLVDTATGTAIPMSSLKDMLNMSAR